MWKEGGREQLIGDYDAGRVEVNRRGRGGGSNPL